MKRDMTELKAGVFHFLAEPLPNLVGGLWGCDLDTGFYTPERIQITHYVSISTSEQPYFIRVQTPEQRLAMFWGPWYRTDKATAERIKHAFLECFVDGLFVLSLWQKKRHPSTVAKWAQGIDLPGVDGVCFDSDAFPSTHPSAEKKETSEITLQEIRDALNARAQRDTAWQELREIREAIKADKNESTADEVRSLVHQRDRLVLALEEMVKGGLCASGFETPCSCRFCRSRALIKNIKGK